MRTSKIDIKMRVIMVLLILSLLVSAFTLAVTDLTRPRQVLGAGGSQASDGKVSIQGTLGQAFVGAVSSKPVSIGQGYWHAGQAVVVEAGKSIFLPLLSKDN